MWTAWRRSTAATSLSTGLRSPTQSAERRTARASPARSPSTRPPATASTTRPRSRAAAARERNERSGRLPAAAPSHLFGGVALVRCRGRRRLVRGDGHLLRRDLAGDHRDVDLFARLSVLVRLAGDEDRRARLELAAEHVVGERILDVALDRAAQRPGAHRRVVALVDE